MLLKCYLYSYDKHSESCIYINSETIKAIVTNSCSKYIKIITIDNDEYKVVRIKTQDDDLILNYQDNFDYKNDSTNIEKCLYDIFKK